MVSGPRLSARLNLALPGLLALLLGCEKEPSKVEQMAKSPASSEPTAAPAPPVPFWKLSRTAA